MWVCDCMCMMWICGSLFMWVTCHFVHVWIYTPTRVRASDLEERRVRYTMVSAHVISLYRRVFDFTVSNVSSVSNLYFSRAERRHVSWYVTVSCVQNQRMYTLCWMNRKIGCMQSEHGKCSFSSMLRLFCHVLWIRFRLFLQCICGSCAIYVWYLPCFCTRDSYV